jgi:hypothetical protein
MYMYMCEHRSSSRSVGSNPTLIKFFFLLIFSLIILDASNNKGLSFYRTPNLAILTMDFVSLYLQRSALQTHKIKFLRYAGGGNAGYVFKVAINDTQYALKMVRWISISTACC